MAIPRLTGYGYGRAASFAQHAANLGSLAGMNLPELGVHAGSAHGVPGGIASAPGTPYMNMANPTRARSTNMGSWPSFGRSASPRLADVAGVRPLEYQGQATMVRNAGALPGQAVAQGRQARSDLWSNAKNQWAAGGIPEGPANAGYRSLSQPEPPPQLALGPGPRIAGPVTPAGAGEPMSRSGIGTWPAQEKPPAPLNPLDVLTGNWGTQPERPPTRVTPYSAVGAAVPSSRPPQARTDPFAAAQGGLPATPEAPEEPGLPPVAAPRSRRVSFNPNQGTLPGF